MRDRPGCGPSRRSPKSQHHSQRMGILAGGALIILGVAFLLAQLGYLGSMSPWKLWPLVLILAGLLKFGKSDGGRSWVSGLLFIGVGVCFQLHYLGYIHLQWKVVWPALLIFFGVMVLGSTLYRARRRRKKTVSSSGLDGFVVFGGKEDRNDSKEFEGGEIFCLMGGYELDLRDARLKEGQAVIHVTAVMGGVKLTVPDDWTVTVKGSPIMGAFEDKTRGPRAGDSSGEQRLVVEGSAIMGGVEITD